MNENTLHFGDEISLYCSEDNGYINAGGFIDQRLWLDCLVPGATMPPNSNDCRFEITTRFQYEALSDLKGFLEEERQADIHYMDSEEAEYDEEFQSIRRRHLVEMEANSAENERLRGTIVTYGTVIQLRHRASGKFVKVLRKVAEENKKALAIVVDEFGAEGSWFRLSPGYKTVADGERVRYGDVVSLLSVAFQSHWMGVWDIDWDQRAWQRLAANYYIINSKEVNAGGSPQRLQIKPVLSHENKVRGRKLLASSAFMLYHKEVEAFLESTMIGDIQLRSTMLPAGGNGPVQLRNGQGQGASLVGNTNMIWMVEAMDMVWSGNPCRWRRMYRIKHVATGLYLAARHTTEEERSAWTAERDATLKRRASGGVAGPEPERPASNVSPSPPEKRATTPGPGDVPPMPLSHPRRSLSHLDGLDASMKHEAPGSPRTVESPQESEAAMSRKPSSVKSDTRSFAQSSHWNKVAKARDHIIRLDITAEEKAERDVRVYLTGDYVSEDCLWSFSPFQDEMDGHVSDNSMFYLHHKRLGWLHSGGYMKDKSKTTAAPRSRTFTTRKIMLLPQREVSNLMMVVPVSESDLGQLTEVTRSLKRIREFTECIEELPAVEKAGTCSPTPSDLNRVIRDKYDLVSTELSRMILSCCKSRDRNPLTREGNPHQSYQHCLRDQGAVNILMRCLTLPFSRGLNLRDKHRDTPAVADTQESMVRPMTPGTLHPLAGGSPFVPAEDSKGNQFEHVPDLSEIGVYLRQLYTKSELDRSSKQSLGETDVMNIQIILQLSCRLLKHFCSRDSENQLALAPHLSTLEDLLERGLQSGSVLFVEVPLLLTEIFQGNAEILNNYVNDDIVRKFVGILSHCEVAKPQFIQFLTSLVVNESGPLPMNQNRVVEYFLADVRNGERNLLLHVDCRSAGALEMDDRPPDEMVMRIREAEGYEWVVVNDYVSTMDEVMMAPDSVCSYKDILLRYHYYTLELLTSLLIGRNRNAFNRLMIRASQPWKVLSYSKLLDAAFNPSLPPLMRSAYVKLLLRLYVDRVPWTKAPLLQFVYLSNDDSRSGEEESLGLGSRSLLRSNRVSLFDEASRGALHTKKSRYNESLIFDTLLHDRMHDLNPFTNEKYVDMTPTENFVDFIQCCLAHCKGHMNFDARERGRNVLTLAVLDSMEMLMSFGFFSGLGSDLEVTRQQKSDLEVAVPELLRMIRSDRDLPPAPHCFHETPNNQLVMNSKLRLCGIMELIFNNRLNLNMRRLFEAFDRKYNQVTEMNEMAFQKHADEGARAQLLRRGSMDDGKDGVVSLDLEMDILGGAEGSKTKPHFLQKSGKTKSVLDLMDKTAVDMFTKEEMERLHRSMFEEHYVHPDFTEASGDTDFIEALLTLTQYNDHNLVESSFRLLSRHLQQRASFIRVALRVQPLLTNVGKDTYVQSWFLTYELRQMCKWVPEVSRKDYKAEHGEDSYDVVTRLLNKLSRLISPDNHTPAAVIKNQAILFNIGAHHAVLQYLSLPLERFGPENEPRLPRRRDLFQQCLNFLRLFVRDNKMNQESMFPHIVPFTKLMGTKDLNVADTIGEIIRNHQDLISRLDNRVIKSFVGLLIDIGKVPRWLRFFDTLLFVNDVPLKNWQSAVLKLLLDNDLLELTGNKPTSEGRGYSRHDLLAAEEHKLKLGSALEYHATSIDIMAKCCAGRTRGNEVKCASLLPFQECMRHIMDELRLEPKMQAVVDAVHKMGSARSYVKPDTMRYMRAPYVRFLWRVYAESRDPVHSGMLRSPDNRWFTLSDKDRELGDRPFVQQIADDIYALRKRLYPSDSSDEDAEIVDKESNEWESGSETGVSLFQEDELDIGYHMQYIFNACIPLMIEYIRTHYSPSTEKSQLREIQVGILDELDGALASLLMETTLSTKIGAENMNLVKQFSTELAHKGFRRSLSTSVRQSRKRASGLVGLASYLKPDSSSQSNNPAFSKGGSPWRSSHALASSSKQHESLEDPDRVYAEEWSMVVHRYGEYIGIKDFKRMVGVGLRNFANLMARPDKNKFLPNLCSFFRHYIHVPSEAVVHYDQTATFLRLLRALLYIDPRYVKDQAWDAFLSGGQIVLSSMELLRRHQIQQAYMGVPILAVELLNHVDPVVSIAALRLALCLLQDGNRIVQSKIAEHLETSNSSNFFLGCRECMRKMKRVIKDRHDITSQKRLDIGIISRITSDVFQNIETNNFDFSSTILNEAEDEQGVEDAHVMEVLLLLGRFCMGQYSKAQDLVRQQPNQHSSIDLLREMVNLAMLLQGGMDRALESGDRRLMMMGIQLFVTLKATVEGPNRQNQDALINSKIFEVLNRLFDKLVAPPQILIVETTNLRKAALDLLLSLLEQRDDMSTVNRFLDVIDWEKLRLRFERNLDILYPLRKTTDGDLEVPLNHRDRSAKAQGRRNLVTVLLEETNLYLFLAKTLGDLEHPSSRELCRLSTTHGCRRRARTRCGMCLAHSFTNASGADRHFTKCAGVVEMSRMRRIERLYYHKFYVISYVNLAKTSMKALVNDVVIACYERGLASLAQRQRIFLDRLVLLTYHICYAEQLRNHKYLFWVPVVSNYTRRVLMAMSVMGCFLTVAHADLARFTWLDHIRRDPWFISMRILSVCHLIFSVVVTVFYFVEHGPVATFRKMFYSGVWEKEKLLPEVKRTARTGIRTTTNDYSEPTLSSEELQAEMEEARAAQNLIHSKTTMQRLEKTSRTISALAKAARSRATQAAKRTRGILGTSDVVRPWDSVSDEDFKQSFTDIRPAPIITWPLQWMYLLKPYVRTWKSFHNWDTEVYFWIFTVPFSILAMLISPSFYAFHLLQGVYQDKVVSNIMRAVTTNFTKLLRTGMVGVLVVYMFAAVSYFFWEDSYFHCTSLFHCMAAWAFMGTSSYIMPVGVEDINVLPASFADLDNSKPVGVFVVSMIFIIVFAFIILSLVTGIIIDTFGELRKQNDLIQDHLRSYCFVCGLSRQVLDDSGVGFRAHIEKEHNLWEYLFLVRALEVKHPVTLEGLHSYAEAVFAQRAISGLPGGSSYSIMRGTDAGQAPDSGTGGGTTQGTTGTQRSRVEAGEQAGGTIEERMEALEQMVRGRIEAQESSLERIESMIARSLPMRPDSALLGGFSAVAPPSPFGPAASRTQGFTSAEPSVGVPAPRSGSRGSSPTITSDIYDWRSNY